MHASQRIMSICFITRKWEPAVGGMETYSKRLTEELSNFADVDIIALSGKKDGMVPTGWQLLKFGVVTALRLITRKPVDVTHLGDMAIWPLGVFAKIRSRKTRVVISAHGTDVSYPLRTGVKAKLYGWYLRLGAILLPGMLIIANSRATDDVARTYGFKNVLIVKLAADSVATKISGQTNGALLFAGRLVKRKGLGWFVRNVLPLLPEDIKIRVAGTVWDPSEAEALNNNRVEFLGALSQSDLREEYASATCVVVPNIDVPNLEFEGFGLIATEAAAAGGVVLAAYHSGLKEAVMDDVTGFHVESGNAQAWAKKIVEISSWPIERRVKFVEGAIKSIDSHYSWSRVAEETFASYQL